MNSMRIGTRGSPLALAQANMVRDRLAAQGFDPARISIVVIRTSGDLIQDRPLSEAGGKGLFTKEIEEALRASQVDIAVHSAKDMPTQLPRGLALMACLEREDVRDAFISPRASSLAALPAGCVVGTASLRRQAQVRARHPGLRVATIRGNVETRLKKLGSGEVDATLLALAGLKRLRLAGHATAILGVDEFLPAVGQGAIAIEAREDDAATRSWLARIDHAETSIALAAERAFLATLEGSCRMPIAGHATVAGDTVTFRGMVLRPDGSETLETSRSGRRTDAATLGADAGTELRGRAGPGFFAGT